MTVRKNQIYAVINGCVSSKHFNKNYYFFQFCSCG